MNWTTNIEIGDILYCLFPFNKETKEPGPFAHYVLVVDIDNGNGRLPIHLTVAYGTSKKTGEDEIYQSELLVTEDRCDSFDETGLEKPTKFDLQNTITLPYEKKYFIKNPKKNLYNPKQGAIDFDRDDDVADQMKEIVEYLQSIGHM